MRLRPELPEPPPMIERLPRHRGYPVPWFVAWIDGEPDFRILAPDAISRAHRLRLCWICGVPLGSFKAFVVGPMCAINRTSAEPPGHAACATWSAKACPFLTRPHMTRREAGLPDELNAPAGAALMRNPGVALVWVTRNYALRPAPGGVLFDIGDPHRVEWYAEGRPATRAEVDASIDSGLPALRELADAQGPSAARMLDRYIDRARALLPA